MKLISPSPRELRQMVRCLELYYRQAKSQKDIARALGVSAATVSRLLKRAYDDGFVRVELDLPRMAELEAADRKSTRLNSSHRCISYAVFCLKKKTQRQASAPARRKSSCSSRGPTPE